MGNSLLDELYSTQRFVQWTSLLGTNRDERSDADHTRVKDELDRVVSKWDMLFNPISQRS